MNKKQIFLGVFVPMLMLSCASKHYQIVGIERTRVIVDSRYDEHPDESAARFIAPYKRVNDSIMGPVESPVLGIYNMGGIRADLTKGDVTYGDVLDIAPFENKICFVTLTGEQMMDLFRQIARRGGEGVSRGTELVITKSGELLSARLHGQEIDPKADYRVATINYLIEGNDGMPALGQGRDIVAPGEASNNTRFLIMNYFREKLACGEVVDSKVEGRIIVKRDK